MIKFRQKQFSEYDAMRSLYVEMSKRFDRSKFGIIDASSLIPILRGNNIVIEKFTIVSSFFGKDKYRMYLKIGAKAKMPDAVRLPSRSYFKRVGNMQLKFNNGIFMNEDDENSKNNLNTDKPKNDKNIKGNKEQKNYSNNNNNQKKDKKYPFISSEYSPNIDLSYEVSNILGNAVKYDKKDRSLVLDFDNISDALTALNILPFGLGYKIYLLNP